VGEKIGYIHTSSEKFPGVPPRPGPDATVEPGAWMTRAEKKLMKGPYGERGRDADRRLRNVCESSPLAGSPVSSGIILPAMEGRVVSVHCTY
jgi:hypothetical protein